MGEVREKLIPPHEKLESHKDCIQQIFIFGNPLFCLIIIKMMISNNGEGNSIFIKLLGHE